MALIGVTGPGVLDTSTTTGTGTYTLAGAITGYQSVGAVLANGDTGYFAACGVDANGNRNGDGWEEFYGTYTSAGTTLARTTVLKSSNSNNAVSWPAGTRRIILLDLPAKAKGLNTPVFGIPLPNVRFVNIQGVNLATGDNDLYTVPAGKRAFATGSWTIFNNSAGNIALYAEAKISGTYYRLVANSTISSGAASIQGVGICLEPADVLAVNVATTSGLNLAGQVIEFDSNATLYSPRVLSLASGDNTIYTCPAGKTAIVLSAQATPLQSGNITAIADGTGQTFKCHLVPSGQSVGVNYQLGGSTSVAANGKYSPTSLDACLGAGDFININSSGGTPPIAWVNILEIGN